MEPRPGPTDGELERQALAARRQQEARAQQAHLADVHSKELERLKVAQRERALREMQELKAKHQQTHQTLLQMQR